MGLRDDTGQFHIGCSRKDNNNRAQLFTGSYSYRTRSLNTNVEMLIYLKRLSTLKSVESWQTEVVKNFGSD